MIDVPENATKRQIKAAIPRALDWRDRLIKFQGRMGLYDASCLLRYIENDLNPPRKSNRYTYAEIAEGINAKIAEYLLEYKGKPLPSSISENPYKKILDLYLFGEVDRVPDPLDRAYQLMKIVRMPDIKIDVLISEGIKNIEGGDEPFGIGSPISRLKVIKVMNAWRDRS